ncbi:MULTISPECIES: hypothetical protein [unclassified Leisingera]|uniref:hypothetical protein n=1 Tax=unclassified Leisingera TaxID=2614906 RepID=UPI00036EB171|nr:MULTISPECIES: hypothetical protein [unclassified Leisingera]KIC54511.1 hypothetical protein RA22_07725 [Leisingera sp. ANG-S]KID10668.1 hypothetical protein GC1_03030 [Leisingera sp. ANG1]
MTLKTITIDRFSPKDEILIPTYFFHPETMVGGVTQAQFDTGNDHTCVHAKLLKLTGELRPIRQIDVNGVTGGAVGRVVEATIGLETDCGGKITISSHQIVVVDGISCDALLGRDMLQYFDVEIFRSGKVRLSHLS